MENFYIENETWGSVKTHNEWQKMFAHINVING